MKKIISILLFLLLGNIAFSQEILSGVHINLKLKSGVYTISGILTIDSSFIIDPGAKIFFMEGASIIINQSIKAQGLPQLPIQFKSMPGQKGNGIVIEGKSMDSVLIDQVVFEELLTPIIFETQWERSAVLISNSVFKNNKSANSIISVLRPGTSNKKEGQIQHFILSKNTFTQNESPIYFEDFSTDNYLFEITENVFYGNRFFDYGSYNFSSNVLFGRADKFYSSVKPLITNNSFVHNLLIDPIADTIVQEANMGIYGTDDSVSVFNNYWGSTNLKVIQQNVYDYQKNYNNPVLALSSHLLKPTSTSPAHVYSVLNESKDTLNNLLSSNNTSLSLQSLSHLYLLANTTIDFGAAEIKLIYKSDTSSRKEIVISHQLLSSPVNNYGEFKLDTSNFKKGVPCYLQIENLQDVNHRELPVVSIGFNSYLKQIFKATKEINNSTNKTNSKDSVTSKKPLITASIYKRKLEAGVIGSMNIYYGTLSNKKIFKNDANGGYGLMFRYRLLNNIGLSLSAMKSTLSGSDLNSDDTAKIARGMSFKSPILSTCFMLEYYFNSLKFYYSEPKVNFGVAMGAEYIKFNPQGQYKGIWYDLQKIGTAGQTSSGSLVQPYQLSAIGIPMAINLRIPVNKNATIQLFGQYHFLFTNYLDDVSDDAYVSPILIQNANQGIPEAAVFFSNPTNRILKSGQLRSATKDANDGYFTFGININYHL